MVIDQANKQQNRYMFKCMKKYWVLLAATLLIIVILVLYTHQMVVFDFEKPIDSDRFSSFANVLTAIFTGIGLIYLYLQVEEMKKQNIESNRPQIFALDKEIEISPAFNYSNQAFFIEIINVGRFHAFNVNYEWRFNKKDLVSYINKKGYIVSNSKIIPFSFGKPISYHDETFDRDSKVVVPLIIAEQSYRVKIFFPLYLVAFLTEYHNELNTILSTDDNETESDKIFKSISLDISYSDTSHKPYKTCYVLKKRGFQINGFSIILKQQL